MRKLFLLLFFSPQVILTSQNVYDTYNPINPIASLGLVNNAPNGFTGEYQTFLNNNPWYDLAVQNNMAISCRIELVSFPFVPDCPASGGCQNGSLSRKFTSLNVLSNGMYDLRNVLNGSACCNSAYNGAVMTECATLSSLSFCNLYSPTSNRHIFPHSILKRQEFTLQY